MFFIIIFFKLKLKKINKELKKTQLKVLEFQHQNQLYLNKINQLKKIYISTIIKHATENRIQKNREIFLKNQINISEKFNTHQLNSFKENLNIKFKTCAEEYCNDQKAEITSLLNKINQLKCFFEKHRNIQIPGTITAIQKIIQKLQSKNKLFLKTFEQLRLSSNESI